jgi:hypothetical protein
MGIWYSDLQISNLQMIEMKFFFLISALLLGIKSFSQTDTSSWDPNDPNCPCHKLANQADEEWRLIQQQELSNMNSNVVVHNNNNNVVANNSTVTVNNSNVVANNNGNNVNQQMTADTTTAVQQQYSSSSGGSSYYHYSALKMKWMTFRKGVINYRKKHGSHRYAKRKRKFRVADCFQFN